MRDEPARRGHAIEARVYAEDPDRFLPSPGSLRTFRPPTAGHVRVETGYREGNVVTPFYDPLLAKVIAWGRDREEARLRLAGSLREFAIEGVRTNIPFLVMALGSDAFRAGAVHTGLAEDLLRKSAAPDRRSA